MTTLLRITDLVYRTNEKETWLVVTGRSAGGERVTFEVGGLPPHVFVDASEPVDEGKEYIVDQEEGYEGYDGRELVKVTLRHPKDTNGRCKECYSQDKSRDSEWNGLQTIYGDSLYEGDVPYVRRAGIDGGLSGYIMTPDTSGRVDIDDVQTDIDPSKVGTIEPRIWMADIEAIPPENVDFNTFKEEATGKITAITIYDTYDEEYTAIVLDAEGVISGSEVKTYIEEHWDDHERAEEFVESTMTLDRCATEEDLLNRFIELSQEKQPDIYSGWNWVDFDHAYILNRMEQFDGVNSNKLSDIGHSKGYRTAQRIDGLPGFDMMEAYCDKMTFSEWRSKRLDYVAEEELGLGKVADVSVGKEYKKNRSRFLAYNIIDTQLLVALDDKNGIHEFFFELAGLSSVQIYDTFSEMRLVDGFLMSHRTDQEILPTGEEKEMDTIPGGLVLEPSDSLHEWVATFDLKSLYPSIFITLNASEETLVYDESKSDAICPGMPESEDAVGGDITEDDINWEIGEPDNTTAHGNAIGTTFEKEGILPKYLRLLFSERRNFKDLRNQYDPSDPDYHVYDNKQRAVKVVMNSFYGVTQSPYYRLSTEDLSATITAGGRYTLWRGAQIARDMGYEVRYGDTDSVLIELADEDEEVTAEEVVDRGEEVEGIINEAMMEVADEFGIGEHPYVNIDDLPHDLPSTANHALYWEFEKLYRRFLQAGSKKRYAGLPVWAEGKWYVDDRDTADLNTDDITPDITGFEAERADVPVVTERLQRQMIQRVLGGYSFSQISDDVQAEIEAVENLDLPPHYIAKPAPINKALEDYPNMEVKRGSLFSNQNLDHNWKEGDDPWLFPISSTPTMVPNTDVLALNWGETPPEGYEIDTEKIIRKKLREPLEPVLSVVDYDFSELKTGRRVQGIDVGGGGDTSGFETGEAPDDPFSGSAAQVSEESEESEQPRATTPDDPFSNDDDAEDDDSSSALDW